MQKAYPKRVRSQNRIFYYKTGLKMRFLSKMWAQNLTSAIYERKYSTAFDKVKNHLCRSTVCLCRLPCASRRASCCATSFRPFPRISATCREFRRLSATFGDFPRLSATFRHFPPLSAPFAGAVEKNPAISAQFPQILRNFPQILEVQCALHGRGRTAQWSSWCTVEVHQVKGVAVVITSGQWRVFHSNKSDCSCNVNRKCNA